MGRQATERTRRAEARTMSRAVATAAIMMSQAALATARMMRPAAAGDDEDEEAVGSR